MLFLKDAVKMTMLTVSMNHGWKLSCRLYKPDSRNAIEVRILSKACYTSWAGQHIQGELLPLPLLAEANSGFVVQDFGVDFEIKSTNVTGVHLWRG